MSNKSLVGNLKSVYDRVYIAKSLITELVSLTNSVLEYIDSFDTKNAEIVERLANLTDHINLVDTYTDSIAVVDDMINTYTDDMDTLIASLSGYDETVLTLIGELEVAKVNAWAILDTAVYQVTIPYYSNQDSISYKELDLTIDMGVNGNQIYKSLVNLYTIDENTTVSLGDTTITVFVGDLVNQFSIESVNSVLNYSSIIGFVADSATVIRGGIIIPLMGNPINPQAILEFSLDGDVIHMSVVYKDIVFFQDRSIVTGILVNGNLGLELISYVAMAEGNTSINFVVGSTVDYTLPLVDAGKLPHITSGFINGAELVFLTYSDKVIAHYINSTTMGHMFELSLDDIDDVDKVVVVNGAMGVVTTDGSTIHIFRQHPNNYLLNFDRAFDISEFENYKVFGKHILTYGSSGRKVYEITNVTYDYANPINVRSSDNFQIGPLTSLFTPMDDLAKWHTFKIPKQNQINGIVVVYMDDEEMSSRIDPKSGETIGLTLQENPSPEFNDYVANFTKLEMLVQSDNTLLSYIIYPTIGEYVIDTISTTKSDACIDKMINFNVERREGAGYTINILSCSFVELLVSIKTHTAIAGISNPAVRIKPGYLHTNDIRIVPNVGGSIGAPVDPYNSVGADHYNPKETECYHLTSGRKLYVYPNYNDTLAHLVVSYNNDSSFTMVAEIKLLKAGPSIHMQSDKLCMIDANTSKMILLEEKTLCLLPGSFMVPIDITARTTRIFKQPMGSELITDNTIYHPAGMVLNDDMTNIQICTLDGVNYISRKINSSDTNYVGILGSMGKIESEVGSYVSNKYCDDMETVDGIVFKFVMRGIGSTNQTVLNLDTSDGSYGEEDDISYPDNDKVPSDHIILYNDGETIHTYNTPNGSQRAFLDGVQVMDFRLTHDNSYKYIRNVYKTGDSMYMTIYRSGYKIADDLKTIVDGIIQPRRHVITDGTVVNGVFIERYKPLNQDGSEVHVLLNPLDTGLHIGEGFKICDNGDGERYIDYVDPDDRDKFTDLLTAHTVEFVEDDIGVGYNCWGQGVFYRGTMYTPYFKATNNEIFMISLRVNSTNEFIPTGYGVYTGNDWNMVGGSTMYITSGSNYYIRPLVGEPLTDCRTSEPMTNGVMTIAEVANGKVIVALENGNIHYYNDKTNIVGRLITSKFNNVTHLAFDEVNDKLHIMTDTSFYTVDPNTMEVLRDRCSIHSNWGQFNIDNGDSGNDTKGIPTNELITPEGVILFAHNNNRYYEYSIPEKRVLNIYNLTNEDASSVYHRAIFLHDGKFTALTSLWNDMCVFVFDKGKTSRVKISTEMVESSMLFMQYGTSTALRTKGGNSKIISRSSDGASHYPSFDIGSYGAAVVNIGDEYPQIQSFNYLNDDHIVATDENLNLNIINVNDGTKVATANGSLSESYLPVIWTSEFDLDGGAFIPELGFLGPKSLVDNIGELPSKCYSGGWEEEVVEYGPTLDDKLQLCVIKQKLSPVVFGGAIGSALAIYTYTDTELQYHILPSNTFLMPEKGYGSSNDVSNYFHHGGNFDIRESNGWVYYGDGINYAGSKSEFLDTIVHTLKQDPSVDLTITGDSETYGFLNVVDASNPIVVNEVTTETPSIVRDYNKDQVLDVMGDIGYGNVAVKDFMTDIISVDLKGDSRISSSISDDDLTDAVSLQ